ncbi:MAG: hypothetical protein JWN36_809 [Microbacteriaceae bacterium]|nr:hypothetical protein [Microbacteriaceae bacterium]
MRVRSKITAALATAALLAVGSGVVTAQAASVTTSGTMSCAGAETHFTVIRAKAANGAFQYQLAHDAGSTFGTHGIQLGVQIVSTGAELAKATMTLAPPAHPFGNLGGSSYLTGTQFRLYGNMFASNGACDNTFDGTLFY